MNPLLIVNGSTSPLLIAKLESAELSKHIKIESPECPATNTQNCHASTALGDAVFG